MPSLARRFRLLFQPLHSPKRYYSNYDFVSQLDLSSLSIYAKLKGALEALAGPGDILDFGCGLGYVTAFTGARGIDLNAEAVAAAARRYPQGRFQVASLPGIIAGGERFKAVTAVNVIEHLTDEYRPQFFATVGQVLAPEGRLVIVYDDMYHPLQLLSGLLHPGMLLTDPTHVHCWTQGRFRQMLEEHFIVEKAEGGNILSRGLPWTNRFHTAWLYVCAPKEGR